MSVIRYLPVRSLMGISTVCRRYLLQIRQNRTPSGTLQISSSWRSRFQGTKGRLIISTQYNIENREYGGSFTDEEGRDSDGLGGRIAKS